MFWGVNYAHGREVRYTFLFGGYRNTSQAIKAEGIFWALSLESTRKRNVLYISSAQPEIPEQRMHGPSLHILSQTSSQTQELWKHYHSTLNKTMVTASWEAGLPEQELTLLGPFSTYFCPTDITLMVHKGWASSRWTYAVVCSVVPAPLRSVFDSVAYKRERQVFNCPQQTSNHCS